MPAMYPPTPYYLIDESRLLRNLKRIERVRERSGAKCLLALKCFSTWAVFDLMKKYMDGTTSSSVYEIRLGHEKFGKETHAYSVGFSKEDIPAVRRYADTIIFNSVSQLKRFRKDVGRLRIGLRANPRISHSDYDLADPGRRYSRLGVVDKKALRENSGLISGLMFHFNCENDHFGSFSSSLDFISREYGDVLRRLEWVSLGGGLSFTAEGYPLEKFCAKLRRFAERFGVQVYLEPGYAAVRRSAQLVTRVVDIVHNELDIAVVDASTEAHMLDQLIYRTPARIVAAGGGRCRYMVAGQSCLAGDVFGTYRFGSPLRVGSTIRFRDAAAYSMVKMNWFNGLKMPSIVVRRIDGSVEVVRRFHYRDFRDNLG